METLDCQQCGACCTHAGDVVVETTDKKLPRHLTRSVRGMVGFGSWETEMGTRIMARTSCNSCVALKGGPGRYSCRIYDKRPEVCREFESGSPECLAARRLAGFVDPDDLGGNPDE